MKKITPIIIILFVVINSFATLTEKEIEIKIKNTAKALGTDVYEEMPVGISKISNLPDNNSFSEKINTPLKNNNIIPEPVLSSDTYPDPKPLSFGEKVNFYWGYVMTFYNAISAQISDSEIFSNMPSFEKISKELLNRTQNNIAYEGNSSLFEKKEFLSEFEKSSNVKFTDNNNIKFLIDGEESFKYKDYLMKNAQKSIWITTWAFYDDVTGEDALKILSEKKKQGIEVKVIVDGKILNSHGVSIVKRMEKAGIEIIKYKESRNNDIWHVKMIIVDNKYMIMGGMNFGDPYSHKDPNGLKWRDTDVLIMGPAVSEASKLFVKFFNESIEKNNLNLNKINTIIEDNPKVGNAKISLVYSDPPKKEGTDILASIIKAIRGANKKINIENAYFVPIPAIMEVLLEARDRGVEINILTNSKDSIDPEAKSVSDISMKSMLPLFKAGVNIYLKKGDTLHSKFMTVDGEFTSIGSYNLHPRGERYDSELNANIIDKENTAYLDSVFEKDIKNNFKITKEEELVPNQSFFSSIIEKYFFSQLNKKI